jgi:putative membrane protein
MTLPPPNLSTERIGPPDLPTPGPPKSETMARLTSSCTRLRIRGSVQFSVITLNVLYAVIGVVLMYVSYRAIDRLTPQVDFPAELQRGNVAVAIFMAAIFISIAMIIGKALG